MPYDKDDGALITRYLLAQLKEDELEQLEERLMSDDDLFDRVLLAEADMVERYVTGELPDEHKSQFEASFLSTREGRRKVAVARALAEYAQKTQIAEERSNAESTTEPIEERLTSQDARARTAWWRRPVTVTPFMLATAALLIVALGIAVWLIGRGRSELNEGLRALNKAYESQRPIDSRITGFPYASPPRAGGGTNQADLRSLNRAERLLIDEASDHPGAGSFHALGQFYLAERDYDNAITNFERALQSDTNNAKIHSDYGAALFEKGTIDRERDNSGKGLDEHARSLEHLNLAIALDPNLLEALFNRALLYQKMLLLKQSQADWEDYLKRETDQKWADEARQKLNEVRSQNQERQRQGALTIDDFVRSLEEGNDDRAWEILCSNRDVISGRLIWEGLATELVLDSAGRRGDRARTDLSSLLKDGMLESQRTGDLFVPELAAFYSRNSESRQSSLGAAHRFIADARENYFAGNYELASKFFYSAAEQFDLAGDIWESTLARLRVAHCFLARGQAKESLSLLEPITELCQKRRFLWLLAHVYNSIARAQTILNESYAYIEYITRSLEIFEKINDRAALQKGLAQLASEYGALGNTTDAMDCLEKCLLLSATQWPGPRQAWRNLDTASTILDQMGLRTAAASFEQEALELSVLEVRDPSFTYLSLSRLGAVYGELREYEKALSFAERGLATARAFPTEKDRAASVAFSLLQLGHIYRSRQSFSQALDSYRQAIELSEEHNLEAYLYGAHKGRLLCYLQQNDPGTDQELATTLNLFDLHRSKIRDDASRNTFFDQEQDVYDLAIDYEFSRMARPERAFEYSETNRARNLLAMLDARPRLESLNAKPKILIQMNRKRAEAQPMAEPEIEGTMPANVQLIQYSVLSDKVLIWVIAKDKFRHGSSAVSLDELKRTVTGFLESIRTAAGGGDGSERAQASRLYDLLVEPVAELLDPGKVICVVPDKVLNQVPFAALYSRSAQKRLVELYPVMTSPSATVFLRQTQAALEKEGVANERALGVGNPAFDKSRYHLPRLYSTEDEVREFTRCYSGPALLTDKAATVADVKREMTRSNLIHFATHYIVNDRYPLLSGLLLASSSSAGEPADCVLHSYEIFDLDLRPCRVVVLAACQTGIERYFKGEGAISLARAFLAAGVPVVVASLWPVNSDATVDLMKSFHKYRTQGLSSVKALCQAEVDMISDTENHRDYPLYWASFSVIGGYANF